MVMKGGAIHPDNPRIERAVAELQTMIVARYPEATFAVWQGEDPIGTYVTATVDVADTDEGTDLVIERLIAMQVEEELPVYVIPVQPIALSRRHKGSGSMSSTARRCCKRARRSRPADS